jgi:predicted P-loop ATPase
VELSEMDTYGRSEAATSKAFVSRRVDRYRPPYGHRVQEIPRQCVFAGTVNAQIYLKDDTGNRRFWPLACAQLIDVEGLAQDRDQLWAESVAAYKAGEAWYVKDKALNAQVVEAQDGRRWSDEWTGRIDLYLRTSGPDKGALVDVSVASILEDCIGIDAAHQGRSEQMRVSSVLNCIGWERFKGRSGGRREWRYRQRKVENQSGPNL